MRVTNDDPITSIGDNQAFHGLEGTYVSSGWTVTVGESGSAIVLDVDAGEGYLKNTQLSTTAGEVEIPNGDSQHPRRDVVYVTSNQTLDVLMGDPAEPPLDADGNRLGPETAPVPAPHDFADINGIPIAHVWVPAGAQDTSDIDGSLHVNDVRLFVDIGGGGSTEQIDRRYLTVGPADLSQDTGGYAEAPITVNEGDEIRVVEWGAQEVNGDAKSNPPTGVEVGLYDPSGAPVQTEETPLTQDFSNGIVEALASNTGVNHYSFRLTNNSSNSFDPDSGQGLAGQCVVEIYR